MKEYTFTISYLNKGIIQTHEETGEFSTETDAYKHFMDLVEYFEVGPYYYLCEWSKKQTSQSYPDDGVLEELIEDHTGMTC